MIRHYIYNIYTVAALLCLASASCSGDQEYRTTEGMIWNTVYHITYQGPGSLMDSIIPELDRVAESVSAFNSNSLVSRINRNESMITDLHLRKIFKASADVNRISNGAFDPTVAPLINAWGFGYDKNRSADTLRIDSILKFTGIHKASIGADNLMRKPDPRMEFNFSSIAKGYGCDAVGDMFRRNGVENYLVEIGGEIAVSGRSSRGGDWSIAIDRPVLSNSREIHQIQTIIGVSGCGVATSGNYRNYRETGNGQRIAHTINPVTGRPVQKDVISATIIAESAMLADAYATACMVLGAEQSKAMIRDQNLAAMLIMQDSTTWESGKFKNLIKKQGR